MTQATASKSQLNDLYDRDLNLWLENAIAQLQAGNLQNLDIENLIEELQGLAGRDKREVASRLEVLIEHILKRCYVDRPECFRGWELTIIGQRSSLRKIFKQSPSLKRYFYECFDDCFDEALQKVTIGYPDIYFPNSWQFDRDLDVTLSGKFWD